ncbi:MAG: hypothetical protein KF726_20600 [Anaerolineae bacterium]|nr:hypothetical protein [Anaerolineae bacterium]
MHIGAYIAERIIETYENPTGTSTVHLARHESSGESAFVTVFQPKENARATQWVTRLQQIQALEHPAIVQMIAGGKLSDGAYYTASRAYSPVLKPEGRLKLHSVVKLSMQISAALDYAHEHGLVHGNLNRQHIVIISEGHAGIRGFEIADASADISYDVRGLARLVHRALTGHELQSVDVDQRVPPAVADVLRAALTSGSGYVTAGEFHAALEDAASQFMVMDAVRTAEQKTEAQARRRAERVARGDAMPSPPSRRGSRLLILLLLIAVLAVGGAAIALFTRGRSDSTIPTAAVLPTLEASATQPPTEVPAILPSETMIATASPTAVPTEEAALAPTVAPTETPAAAAVLPTEPASATPIPPTETATEPPTIAPTETPLPTNTPEPPTATITLTFTATSQGLVTATSLPSLTPSSTPVTPTITPTFTITPLPTITSAVPPTPIFPTLSVAETLTNPCVSMVGDSVTAGTGVYEVPLMGYAFVQAAPMAQVVEEAFARVGMGNIKGINRGSPNTGISTSNHPSYFATPQYAALLEDHCRYTVIMPWINDITPAQSPDAAAVRHAAVIGDLVTTIVANNPFGRVVVLNYYTPVVSQFAANSWAAGFNPTGISLYNAAIANSCQSGALSTFRQVTCLNIHELFADMGDSHVIRYTTRDELNSIIIEPVRADMQQFLDVYFRDNPGGAVLGDGVHLSPRGKQRLAEYLVTALSALPPLEGVSVNPTG